MTDATRTTDPVARRVVCVIGSAVAATLLYFGTILVCALGLIWLGVDFNLPRLPQWLRPLCVFGWGLGIWLIAKQLYPKCRRRYG